ncbi:MAG: hypothetical protein U1E22_10270 [Coriobacteriia bacterium]|nr:hypothetical protein [Coriobacteriia bacterium]
MSGRFAEYETTGPAQPGRVRSASVVDYAAAVVIGVIIFPFPIVRAYVSVWVFVVSILVVIGVAHALYIGLTSVLLGRTPGMYLFDLGFGGERPGAYRAMMWGFGSAVVFWPSLIVSRFAHPERGIPAMMSGVRVRATGS